MQIFGYTIIKTEILEQLRTDLEKAVEHTGKLEAELMKLAIIDIKKLKAKHEDLLKKHKRLYIDFQSLKVVVKDKPNLERRKLNSITRDALFAFYDPWISRLREAAKLK